MNTCTPNDWAAASITGQVFLRFGICRIVNNGHTSHLRGDLLEQFQPFRTDRIFKLSEPGNIAARSCHARNEPRGNRIGDLREYDGHAAGFSLQRRQRG
jgi:hypothetical protein